MLLLEWHIKEHGKAKITEEQKRELENLGIVSELSKREERQQTLIAKQQQARELYNTALISCAQENQKEDSRDNS